jgi:hypothetical protein
MKKERKEGGKEVALSRVNQAQRCGPGSGFSLLSAISSTLALDG